MRLDVYRSLWGYSAPVPRAVTEIAAAGYDGIEVVLPEPGDERSELLDSVGSAGLGFIPLVANYAETVDEHLSEFRGWVEDAESLGVPMVVMHTGRDHWPLADAIGFYEAAAAIEAEVKVKVAHETHRGRPLVTPWATSAILAEVPELALCCDFSHWVLVAERILEDQEERIAEAASRCLHVHARLGTDQAPQVLTPGDPANDTFRTTFERWWLMVWAVQEARGLEVATATPEFGPPPYQPVYPGQVDAEAELRDACNWQANRLRELFGDRSPTPP